MWQLFIDNILFNIGFQPTTHETCVYSLPKDKFGEEIFLLCQVDDFAIGCDNPDTTEKIWTLINKQMSVPLKREGLIHRFNGIDV